MDRRDERAIRAARLYTDEIFHNFELYFPSMARKAADYYLSDDSEITVVMEDDSRVKFDNYMQTVRCISPYPENPDEERWRKEFSYKLLKKMNKQSLSQQGLAEVSGVSQCSINRYLNQKSTPTVFAASKLAKALGCTVDDLLDFNV